MTDLETMRKLALASILAAASMMVPASAAPISSDWEVTDGGRMRLVVGQVSPVTGKARGFLEIDMKPGWKTYWREPGSSGVPPQITPRSADVVQVEISFPLPEWIETDYGNFAGYTRPVRLPFEAVLTEGASRAMLDAQVLVGICEEICIPALADFSLPLLPEKASALPDPDIEAAFAALPETPPQSSDLARVESMGGGKALVTFSHAETDQSPVLFAAARDGSFPMAHPVLVSSAEGKSTYEVRPARPLTGGEPRAIVLTLGAGERGVETVAEIDFN